MLYEWNLPELGKSMSNHPGHDTLTCKILPLIAYFDRFFVYALLHPTSYTPSFW